MAYPASASLDTVSELGREAGKAGGSFTFSTTTLTNAVVKACWGSAAVIWEKEVQTTQLHKGERRGKRGPRADDARTQPQHPLTHLQRIRALSLIVQRGREGDQAAR
jgi:hypothetical protein